MIDTGLIIDVPWINFILDDKKVWEMRCNQTKKRGKIALIKKGSKAIYGIAELIDSKEKLSTKEMIDNFGKHQIPIHLIKSGKVDKWRTPWVLANVVKFDTPIPYVHKAGCVIWVPLDEKSKEELKKWS